MALYKFQVIAAQDTLLARDAVVNDLYFTRVLDSGDDEGLCTDLANVFNDGWYVAAPQIEVKMYDVGAGPSGPPRASAMINDGSSPSIGGPREVALCLSFWATNRQDPHRRGRIYLSVPGHGGTDGSGKRPSPAIITAALDLGDDIAGIGGADVSWQVYSPTLSESNDVTNTWVDDEWDTIRSRGLRATMRTTRGV